MQTIREQFARSGLRCTRQRLLLYETLQGTKSHPTAEELYRMVAGDGGGLSRATVYNALEAFSTAGLCRKLPTEAGSVRYDADLEEHLHVRFLTTGRVIDVPDDLGRRFSTGLPRGILREIEQRLGVTVDGVQVLLLSHDAGARSGAD